MTPRQTVLCGLIGHGIQASLTPAMHEREGDEQGLRSQYKLIDLQVLGLGVEALPELLQAAGRMGFTGLNITHPCKQAVIPLLDELSPDAAALGAVNTVLLRDGSVMSAIQVPGLLFETEDSDALNAHAVDYAELPDRFARTRPGHGSIPAAYISMIGRDQKFRGGGYGGDLLVDALRRIAVAADAIGVAVVLLDVLDCGDPERVARRKVLYESYGFQSLASNPLRMYLPVSVVRKLVAEA